MKPRHSGEQERTQDDKVESNRIILPPITGTRRNYGDTRKEFAFGTSSMANPQKKQPFESSERDADAQKEARTPTTVLGKEKERNVGASQGGAMLNVGGSEAAAPGSR